MGSLEGGHGITKKRIKIDKTYVDIKVLKFFKKEVLSLFSYKRRFLRLNDQLHP